jgi:hypothetical protein
VLLVSAVDRFGMAQALALKSKSVVYGDLLFGLGLPVPIRSYPAVETLGRLLLPVVTRLPFKWFYPTGDKQDMRTPKHLAEFEKADVICGDWHYIRRFAPDRLEGKIVITQTLRHADLDLLKQMGVKTAIATTPIIDGESFATNVMEGVVLTLMQKRPEEVEHEELVQMLDRLKWKPNVMSLGSGSLT